MNINIFNHSYKAEVNAQLEGITQKLRPGDSIKAIHTPIVLPFTANEVGGYARSIEVPFCGKWIALNCQRFKEENSSMKEFILSRQVALFNKPSRYLHIPLGATVIAIGFIASSILFSSPLAIVGITTLVAAISANLIAKRDQENEKYADLVAFSHCQDIDKKLILDVFEAKKDEEANTPRSFLKYSFSSYPSYTDRYDQLAKDKTFSTESKNLYPSTDIVEEAIAN